MSARSVQVITRPTLTAKRRAMGLDAARYLRTPEIDETPLSRAEVSFAIRQGIIKPLPLRRVR
jgi:hypothetical protein